MRKNHGLDSAAIRIVIVHKYLIIMRSFWPAVVRGA